MTEPGDEQAPEHLHVLDGAPSDFTLPVRRRWPIVTALALAVAVAGLLLVDREDSLPPADPVEVELPAQSLDEAADAVVADLAALVARTRGLDPVPRPSVELTAPARVSGLVAAASADRDRRMASHPLLVELIGRLGTDEEPDVGGGAVGPGEGEGAADGHRSGSAVGPAGAAFDPTHQRIVLVADADLDDPGVRRDLVDALLTMLVDHHYGLSRPELDEGGDDRDIGFATVAEGDLALHGALIAAADPSVAVRPTDAITLDVAAAARRAAEEAGGPPDLTPVLAELFEAAGLDPLADLSALVPGLLGPGVAAFLSDDGLLDRAYVDPPATLEHLLHPGRWLDGESSLSVEQPPSDAEPVTAGGLGPLRVAQLMVAATPDRTLAQALEDVDDWGGDQSVLWRVGERVCIRLVAVSDRRDGRMLPSLETLGDEDGRIEVRAAGPESGSIEITACVGSEAPPPTIVLPTTTTSTTTPPASV